VADETSHRRSYDYSYGDSYEYSGIVDELADDDCDIPSSNGPPRDPLHIQESRDVHGYASKQWDWNLAACQILRYNVTFEVTGTTGHSEALAVSFHVELRDPDGQTVVEDRDTTLVSESRTALNWTLKPGASVKPGEWSLRFGAVGDLHYDVEVYLEY